MKKIIAMLAGALVTSGAAHAQAIFTELNAGLGLVPDQEFDVIYDDGFDQIAALIVASSETNFTGGVEIGFRGVGSKHISLSASYDYMEANLESLSVTGTVNGMMIDETVSRGDFAANDLDALDLDAEFHTIMGHVRYDFTGPDSKLQPYVGIGGGATFGSESRTAPALGVTAGLRVPLGYGFYGGLRYRYIHVFPFEDDYGIEWDDAKAHLFTLTLGAMAEGSRH